MAACPRTSIGTSALKSRPRSAASRDFTCRTSAGSTGSVAGAWAAQPAETRKRSSRSSLADKRDTARGYIGALFEPRFRRCVGARVAQRAGGDPARREAADDPRIILKLHQRHFLVGLQFKFFDRIAARDVGVRAVARHADRLAL